MIRLTIRSPIGPLTVTEEDDAIVALDFADKRGKDETPLLKRARTELDEYFSRKRQSFGLPLRLGGSSFQRAVWKRMLAIPYGETESYGQVAKALGSAPRAVGGACGANSIAVVIPCHRVVGTHGSLGGFMGVTEGDPLSVKRWLLKHEGYRFGA